MTIKTLQQRIDEKAADAVTKAMNRMLDSIATDPLLCRLEIKRAKHNDFVKLTWFLQYGAAEEIENALNISAFKARLLEEYSNNETSNVLQSIERIANYLERE